MKRTTSRKVSLLMCAAVALALPMAWSISGCKATVSAEIGSPEDGDDPAGKDNPNGGLTEDDSTTTDGISYANQPNGTLTIRNNTKKDMVLFEGETPTKDTILGGVYAQSSRAFDVSAKNDFTQGGWMIIKGMAASEYAANKSNLSNAKIEYSALATYHEGEYYEAVINPAYTGDYCFKVNNNSAIGIELHKDSFNGEKIAYLAPYKRNYYIYCETPAGIDLFPVYVYYSTRTKTVTTVNSDVFSTVLATPYLANDTRMNVFSFPADPNATLAEVLGKVEIPYAYLVVKNSVPNQGARFNDGSTELKTQGGQDSVSGIPLTFEIKASKDGLQIPFYFSLYGGQVKVPVQQEKKVLETNDGEDGQTVETEKVTYETPVIKNGYDYNVTLTLIGTDVSSSASYKAIIDAGTKRDVMSEIETLPSQQ